MSYTRSGITVICKSNPEATYRRYYSDIEKKIIADGYIPKTSIENLIKMIILYFDCDDNYGEFDAVSGCGGYGDGFTLEGCFQYIEDGGGYETFEFYS